MRKLILLSGFVSLAMFGCSTPGEGELAESGATLAAADDTEGKADSASAIAFTAFDDDIGSAGTVETRKVFTSAYGYASYFGHAAPSTIDFAKQWVVFYSAGTESDGGYQVSIESISKSKTGSTLKVTTSLSSPGVGCLVPHHVTKPYVLASFKKQPSVSYVQYYRDDQVRTCQSGPTCGGIAGLPCPGMGRCVDNPNDSCDPAQGGADCGGTCVCIQTVACMVNSTFNSDPHVCACVPNAPTGDCLSDADCTIVDNYCGGCACTALGPGQTAPTCSNPVNCFAEPCAGKAPWCNPANHKCEARPATGIACGTNHCGTGEYCCNASCGICAPMGAACIQIACLP